MKSLKITPSITNRDARSLDKYLSEIGKVDMVTVEEEVLLAQKIRAGDQAALERLTRANLRFVISVAKQFQNQGLALGDLISEGNIGLICAARRFDETRGFKFISYAVWWIRQAIMQAIAEQVRIVRLPLNQLGNLSRMSKAVSSLEQRLEREPSAAEIAEVMESTADRVTDIQGKSGRHLSIDAPLRKDEEGSLLDVLADQSSGTDDVLMLDSLRIALESSLRILNERQQHIIRLFYGIGLPDAVSLSDIAVEMGITRERVRQLKDAALASIRQSRRGDQLRNYL